MQPVDYLALGPKLKAARMRKGLTQKDVARRLGMTDANVSRIEGGALTSIETLAAYAEIVGGELAVVVAMPDDRLARVAARLARLIPRFNLDADRSLVETLEAWSASWEAKYGAARKADRL